MAISLRGDQGTFTYTAGSDSLSLTGLDLDAWEARIERGPVSSYRPFGFALPRVNTGGLSARGRLHFVVLDGTTPPIPQTGGATTGTIVLGVKGTTQKYTFKGTIYSVTQSPNSTRNDVQDGWFEFVASGDSSSDTIVVA